MGGGDFVMFAQMPNFFNNVLSNQLCGFWKCCSTQQWKMENGNVRLTGVTRVTSLLTEFPKVCNCRNHEHLIAKRNAYEFSSPDLELIYNCL